MCPRFIRAQGGGGGGGGGGGMGKSTDLHWTRAFDPFIVRVRPPLYSIHV